MRNTCRGGAKRVASYGRAGRGFTLIELLVVIAIIALLVTILAPSLQNAKDLARKAICMTRLKNLGTAYQFYWQDFEWRNPPFRHNPGHYDYNAMYWMWLMRPYVGLECPSNLEPREMDPEKNDLAAQTEHFNCPMAFGEAVWHQPEPPSWVPEETTYSPGGCSLGINYHISYNDPDVAYNKYHGGFRYPKMMDLPDPSRVLMNGDSGRWFITYEPGWSYHPLGNNSYDPRHAGRVEIVYADSHVGERPYEWFYPWNEEANRAIHWPEVLDP